MTALFLVNPTKDILIGRCVETPRGWRFIPHTAGRRPSRKFWPTALACIPRWANRIEAAELLDLSEAKARGYWHTL